MLVVSLWKIMNLNMIKNTNSNWNWNHCGLCSNELSTSSGGRTTAKNSSNITSAKAKRCALGWKKLKSQKEGDFSPLKSNHTLEYTPIFRLRLTSIAPAAPILQKNSVLVLGMCNPLFNVCVHAQWTPNIPFLYILYGAAHYYTDLSTEQEHVCIIAKGKSLISQLS